MSNDTRSPVVSCRGCGEFHQRESMDAIDVSRDDEYYPRFVYVCPGCQRRGGQ